MIFLNDLEAERLRKILQLSRECMSIQNSGVSHGEGFTLDIIELEAMQKALEGKLNAPAKSKDDILDDAVQAFFSVVASNYPEVKSGDMSPHEVFHFEKACKNALNSWLENNQ